MSELLALLGRAGPRLLLWPGGAALLLLAVVLLRRRGGRTSRGQYLPGLAACAAPLLALVLLPLPGTATLDRELDLATALALLELPYLLQAAALYRRGERQQLADRLAILLNYYPLLLLAALMQAEASASLSLSALTSGSGLPALVGGWTWVLALGPLLGRGQTEQVHVLVEAGLLLRRIGHLLLASLLLAASLPDVLTASSPEVLAGWLRLGLGLGLAGLLLRLAGLLRRRVGAVLEPVLALLLTGGLLVLAAQQVMGINWVMIR